MTYSHNAAAHCIAFKTSQLSRWASFKAMANIIGYELEQYKRMSGWYCR